MNKILSILLFLSILLLSYPLIDQTGINTTYLILLAALIIFSISSLVWNFSKEPISKVLGILIIIDLIVGLVQFYYFFTMKIY